MRDVANARVSVLSTSQWYEHVYALALDSRPRFKYHAHVSNGRNDSMVDHFARFDELHTCGQPCTARKHRSQCTAMRIHGAVSNMTIVSTP